MKTRNVKPTPYIPPELELITFECSDIITTSYTDDENEDPNW